MNDVLISVIIPVYNVEKYINECVESVINQTYRNIEIILVDDGSTDSSGIICDELKNVDGRVKVIHNENQGPGATRNSGIAISSGEYIAFVDSDDYINPVMYESMIANALENDSDIVYSGGFYKFLQNGKYNKVSDVSAKEFFCENQIEELAYSFVSHDNKLFGKRLIMSPCRALYRRNILPKFIEEKGMPSEDLAFNVECVFNSRKVSFLPDVFYWYRYNDSSLTRTFCFDKYRKYRQLTKILNNIFLKHGSHYSAEYCMMISVVDMLRGMNFSTTTFSERKGYIQEMAMDTIWDSMELNMSKMSIGNKLIYILLKYHSSILLQIFSECYYFVRKRLPK